MTWEEIQELLPDLLEARHEGIAFRHFQRRGQTVSAIGDLSAMRVPVVTDSAGRPLVETERRTVSIESETHYTDESTGETRGAVAGSAARAWRQLGLIDDRGHPTPRGVIFSFFQHGEGLAVAAALEDEHYPIDELVWHLANLRAGHRFEQEEGVEDGGSERLAILCRQAYGPVDHEGYLRLGLPIGYGAGAAEAIRAWSSGERVVFSKSGVTDFDLGPGDVERAFVEWLSLLRHVRGAPDMDLPRWQELKEAAAGELARRRVESPLSNLPEFPQTELARRPQHRLSFRQIQSA